MALSGIFGYFVADLLGIKSLVVIGPRLTLLLQALLPVFVTALAFFFNNESLATIQLLGIAVTLLGIIWVVLEQPQSPKEIRHRKKFALGVISAVASAVFAALGIFFAKKVMAGTDPLAATQLRILAGLACYPFLLTFLRRWRQVGQAACNFRAMIILQLGTIIGPVIAMILYMDALKTCPSMGIATTILSLTPIMILPFSVLVYKEKVSPRAVFGAILSAVGVMLMMC
jgi:drug/metabolite transporter (DMT)-like permease